MACAHLFRGVLLSTMVVSAASAGAAGSCNMDGIREKGMPCLAGNCMKPGMSREAGECCAAKCMIPLMEKEGCSDAVMPAGCTGPPPSGPSCDMNAFITYATTQPDSEVAEC